MSEVYLGNPNLKKANTAIEFSEEQNIPIELLQNLQQKHDDWLMNPNMTNKIVLNNDNTNNYEDFAKIIEQYIDGNLVL